MANPVELTRYIRFQLSELGAKNAHHEFENLAFDLAKARICSNIIPATGPVSAGGDGGRDFETFKSYIKTPLTPDNSFYKISSGEQQILFSCSIQKKAVQKIQSELKRMKSANNFQHMTFFCEANIPVAKRQKLQTEAESFGATLDIFDGEAIAKMLSDRDTFWIAQCYLQVPSHLMPISDDSVDWYRQLAEKWVDKKPLLISYSDFTELQLGIRRSTFHESARPDLTMWAEKLKTFLAHNAPRELQRWACYEIIVALFRGTNSLTSLDLLISDYLSDLNDHLGTKDLLDAVNLKNYLAAATLMNTYPNAAPNIPEFENRLLGILESGVTEAPGPGRRAELLRMLGMFYLGTSTNGVSDLSSAARYWSRMFDEAKAAKFFPLQEFSQFYTKILKELGNPDELIKLAPKLDDLVAARTGLKQVGKNIEERGDTYRDRGEFLRAITEYLRARKRLYDGGDERALLRVVIKLAECFRSLGLAYAAKYYALSAAWMAANPSKPTLRRFLPEALLTVSETEYIAGNFLGFAHYGSLARLTELMHSDWEHPTPIAENIGHIYGLLGLLKRKSPETFDKLKPSFSNWPAEIFGDVIKISSAPGFWSEKPIDAIASEISALLTDRPWGDLVDHREVKWFALGIKWTFRFKNDYSTGIVAEKLIGKIQFALAAISLDDVDLLLIPTSVSINFSASRSVSEFKINEVKFKNEAWNFTIQAPTKKMVKSKHRNQSIAVTSSIIGTLSLFKNQDFISRSKGWIQTAVNISFNFQPYEIVLSEFTPEDAITVTSTFCKEAPFEFTGSNLNFLSGFSGLAPNYNQEAFITRISERYAAAIPNIKFTARKALEDPTIASFLRELHANGMKDWYLLCIINGMALQARVDQYSPARDELPSQELTKRLASEIESPDTALHLKDYTPMHLRAFETAFAPLLMSSLGLDSDIELLQDPATLETIKDRFNLKEVDVEHMDVFDWTSAIHPIQS
ncbi:hypothetical protein GIV19_19750 [Pseudomonas syringae]|uniref:hypothetical protein n=1 Tax=Pseudomonas syringae TaxID=317 RepID=UPI001F1E24DE|nr:hypothetical protein [Pseudomonas syringae]MCF5709499.1 hypothetical protein [Pseudomonas syringae]